MVAVKHDKRDKVIAYVDYEIVDKQGKWDRYGEYCWVRHLWIHKSVKNKYTLKDFVETEHRKFPTVRWIYYQKEKGESKRTYIHSIVKFYRKERTHGKG